MYAAISYSILTIPILFLYLTWSCVQPLHTHTQTHTHIPTCECVCIYKQCLKI